MVRDRVEPFIDGAVKLGLAAGEHVPHRLDAHRSLGLQPRQLEQLLVAGLRVAPAQRARGENCEHNHAYKCGQRDRNGEGEKMIGHLQHPTSIRRMGTKYER